MKKFEIKDIVLLIIALITILINITLYTKLYLNLNEEEKKETVSEIQKSPEETELEKLQKMTERDRIEYYFSKFINYINEEEYEKAYELLYPEFKDNYFKTEQEFEKYVKKIYPKSVGFSYNDIDRQGNIYVLMITVIDTNKKVGEEKSQRIVVRENDINKFELSFQVI